MRSQDRFRGCLIGGAAGDALGYAVEFLREGQIFRRYGEHGITEYELTGGIAQISDDTQMTLFTANGLLLGMTRGMTRGIGGPEPHYIGLCYRDWLKTQEVKYSSDIDPNYAWLGNIPELYSPRAPGTGAITEINPSNIWYEERESFGPDQVSTERIAHSNRGFELLQGSAMFSGKILGGCIDSMYDIWNGERYADMPVLCEKYRLFPDHDDWKGRILLLESSEEKPTPDIYRQALLHLKNAGVFDAVSGVLVGKPMDETYTAEYKKALIEVINNPELPVVCNLSIGHATPRCIIPFGVEAQVDAEKQTIRFLYKEAA